MSLIYIMLLALPSSVQVTLAPDQPMPYVYIDDPLIVEFYSESETDIDATLNLQESTAGEQIEIELGRIHLHPESGYWYAIHDAPKNRGFYKTTITIKTAEDTITSESGFCRIDRPASLQRIPVYAYCSEPESVAAFPAIHSVGVNTFRCDMDNEQFAALASNVALFDSDLIVAMTLERARQFSEEDIALIQSQCDNVFRLDISLDSQELQNQDLTEVIRRIGCPAGISIVVANAASFEQQLLANPSLSAQHATLMTFDWPEPAEVEAIKNVAAQQGQEGWQVHVLCPVWQPRNTEENLRFIHKFFQYRAANASYIGLNANVLTNDTGVREMMSYLNGLALRFRNCVYVGTLPAEGAVQAPVFRDGSAWFAALWSEKEDQVIAVPVDGAVSLKLTDALGNDLPLPEIENGVLKIKTSLQPCYLTGNGGVTVGRAALQEVAVAAGNILNSKLLTSNLQPAILDMVRAIAAEPQGTGSRLRFLELLRVLPGLEEDWHTRKLPREIAVPAIRAIVKLARALCPVEEDRGERFLEPISDTIDRAGELQSLYLTGSAGTAQARKRGDWILGEVRRLIDEAETLEQGDRKIEAAAVATLAEWRAHCLISAAQAEPPRENVPEIQPLILPEPAEDATTQLTEGELEAPAPEGNDEGEPADEQGQQEEKKEPQPEEPQAVASPTEKNAPKNVEKPAEKEVVHTVKSGDNPYTIAKKYKVSLDDLLKWNNLKRNAVLRIGQKLVVKTGQ
jgi:hypothetical protein